MPAETAVDAHGGLATEATIGGLLRGGIVRLRAAGCELPRLDAELLLGHATGLDRVAIVAHPERPARPAVVARYRSALARRERGEPVAYIRGVKEFRGLAFRVDTRALIPRPETERLVELGLQAVHSALSDGTGGRVRVVDVGTGSGAVAIALAAALRQRAELHRVEVLAVDRSAAALGLARENVAAHGLGDDIRLLESDLVPLSEGQFDAVLANLPYVPSGDLPSLPIAASFEPRDALDGGHDGLAVVRRLLERLPNLLAPAGTALFEIGSNQAEAVREAVAGALPGWRWRIERDLSNLPRVAIVERSQLERSGIGRQADHAPRVHRAHVGQGCVRT